MLPILDDDEPDADLGVVGDGPLHGHVQVELGPNLCTEILSTTMMMMIPSSWSIRQLILLEIGSFQSHSYSRVEDLVSGGQQSEASAKGADRVPVNLENEDDDGLPNVDDVHHHMHTDAKENEEAASLPHGRTELLQH